VGEILINSVESPNESLGRKLVTSEISDREYIGI